MTFFEEKHCHINNKVIFFINITILCIVHSKPTQLLCMHIRAITSYSKFEREKKKKHFNWNDLFEIKIYSAYISKDDDNFFFSGPTV